MKKEEKNRTYTHIHARAEGQRKSAAGIGETAAAKRHCSRVAAIVNQLARIVNKSPFYNSTAPRRTTSV